MKKLLTAILLTFSTVAIAQTTPVTPGGVTGKRVYTELIVGIDTGSVPYTYTGLIKIDSAFQFKGTSTVFSISTMYTRDQVDSVAFSYAADTTIIATKAYVDALVDSLGELTNITYPDSSVLFVGSDGKPTTDSAYFRWDENLHVLNVGPGTGGDEINVTCDSGENAKISILGSTAGATGIFGNVNWGTLQNPAPRPNRGTLLEISAMKWDGTNFTSTRGASMTLFSTQAPWSATANGMGVKFYCVDNNSTISKQSVQIWGNGNFSLSDVSSGPDTAWKFYCPGDAVFTITRPSVTNDDSIMVKANAFGGGELRAWRRWGDVALKNDTNSFTGINIGGKVGTDEINVYADAGENAKQYFEGTGSSNGIFGTRNFGTIASPLPPSVASTLITFGNAGWNGTAFTSVKRGSFDVFSTQAWGASNNACGIRINYVPNASTTSTMGFQIWSNGNATFSSNSADTLYKVYADGEIRASGKITAGDDVTTSSGGSFTWSGGKSRITSNTNGTITLSNNAISGFNLLYFGGTTSAFPAIQRQNNVIRFLVSDTSAYAGVQTGQLSVNSAPNASAALTVTSTTQGFLPPVMTSTQASAISSPATGLLLYVTDTNGTFTSTGWWGYNGATWEKLNN